MVGLQAISEILTKIFSGKMFRSSGSAQCIAMVHSLLPEHEVSLATEPKVLYSGTFQNMKDGAP